MEQNSKQYNLKELFMSLVAEGLNDDNKILIESFLCGVLDTPQGNEVFKSSLFYNFILLLKAQPTTTFLLNHLIQEIELKSLRLTYMSFSQDDNCCNQPNNNNNNNNKFQGMNQFNVSPVSDIIDIAEGRKAPNDRRTNR